MQPSHSLTRRHFLLGTSLGLAGPFLPAGAAEPARTARHEWPQYKGDNGLTGASPDPSIRPPLKLVWEYRTDGDTSGDAGTGVIVAGGKVFVTVINTASILALDAADGRFLWEYNDRFLSHNSVPTYHAGRLYVWKRRSNRSEVLALDAGTGKALWTVALAAAGKFESRAGLPIHDGKLFCAEGGEEPAIVALEAATGQVAWRAGLGKEDGTCAVAPTVADGRVFAATRTTFNPTRSEVGAITALSAADGKVLWRRKGIFPLKSPTSDGRVVACPMYLSADQKFYLLDARTGETLWTAPPRFFYSPTSLTDDLVLIKPYGGDVIALERASGKELWRFSGKTTSGCCAPVISGQYAYFGTGVIAPGDLESLAAWQHVHAPREKDGYGTLFALDLKTGKPAWSFATGNTVCGEPALAYGRLYFGGRDGKVYCLEPARAGEPTFPLPRDTAPAAAPAQVRALLAPEQLDRPAAGMAWPMAGGSPARAGFPDITLNPPLALAWKVATGGRVVCAAAIRDGRVFVGSDAGKVLAIEGTTGRIAWETPTGSRVRSSPAVVDGLVYVGADDGRFGRLDAATGKEKWAFAAGGPIQTSPAVVGGIVLFAANDHALYALDRRTGRKLWHFQAAFYAWQAAPVVQGDRVFAAPWVDWVHALDLATGQQLWRSFVPITIEALVMHRDLLYVRSPNYVAELDPATGKRIRIGSASYGYNSPAFRGGQMFVTGVQGQYGTNGGTITNLDDEGRELTRPIPTLENVRQLGPKGLLGSPSLAAMGTPLVLGERLCFATRDGKVVVTEPTGKVLWSHALEGTCHSSPVAAAGLLVVGGDDGNICAFRSEG